MGKIVLLDELTINQIAAGEVIERPASVIKEMVENSIDAGATNICVEIKNGGISYIQVTDNGKGIEKDDMEIAFERHATSKIRSAEDLNTVKSMGFRGEALASIAAIANVELKSKTPESETGNRIVVEAGKVLEFEEIGCPAGTTIIVKDLFFNTPVRYKFLKKDYTESGYIEDAITRLAIVNPNIAFKLINTGKTIIQTSGNGKIEDVIYAIYGRDIAGAIINVDYTYEDMHITGVIGKPEIARSNRSNQLFFVNKRYVKDKTLTGAVENSFKGMLPIGKYAFVVLNIDMPSSKVDVNVHPAKLEVRFQEDNKVFKAVYHSIKDTLLKTELISNADRTVGSQTPAYGISQEEEQPKNIAELFKKISSEPQTEPENNSNTTIIEDIYNRKNSFSYSNPEKSNVQNNISIDKMDVFKELMEMQKKLKEEVENDPTLKTNIDKIIDSTNELKANAEEEIKKQENEEQENINIEQEIQDEEIIKNEIEEKEEVTPKIEEKPEQELEQITTQQEEIIEQEQVEQENFIEKNNIEEENSEKEKINENTINQMIQKIEEMPGEEINPEFINMYKTIFGKLPASVEEKQKEEENKFNAYELIKDNNLSVFENSEIYNKPVYKFVGIVFKTYIIVEIEKEMYIIDQHAAHERIMYEKVKKNYYSEEEKEAQMLLLPDIITLTHKEMDIARDNFEMFRKAGFELEEFGENTIKLSGVPDMCVDLDTKELFLETLDEINTVARTAKQEIEERFIATVACKAAVKANMALTKEEVDALMNELLKLPNPFTCPHGRPTAIKMSQTDIEKKFARRK